VKATIGRRLAAMAAITELATLVVGGLGVAGFAIVLHETDKANTAADDLHAQLMLALALERYIAEARDVVQFEEDDEDLLECEETLESALAHAGGSFETEAEEAAEEHEEHTVVATGVQRLIEGVRAIRSGARDAEELEDLSEELVQEELTPALVARMTEEEAERDEAAGELRQATVGILVAQMLCLLFALAAVWLVVRKVQREIAGGVTKLASAARAIGEGRLGERVSLEAAPAELVLLADTLSTTSESLLRAREESAGQAERLHRMEKLAALGGLAGAVGHELRNPLGVIRNAHFYVARKLKGTPLGDDPKIGEFLALADRELEASRRIIDDLLDFARAKPLDRAQVPLKPLIDEVLSLVPARPGVDVKVAVPEALPWLSVDRAQFRQVIANLVQNAIQAIPNERAGTVEVRATRREDAVRIEVADDGEGIEEKDLARIFEPLFTRKSRGTGLGLAIVRNVVDRHGARIGVRSVRGAGTTFEITMPVEAG
jgi:signal transduction histidine kinase